MSQQFQFKVGDRVQLTLPGTAPRWVRVLGRTIEPGLGRTYEVRYPNGRWGGWVPETWLRPRENSAKFMMPR